MGLWLRWARGVEPGYRGESRATEGKGKRLAPTSFADNPSPDSRAEGATLLFFTMDTSRISVPAILKVTLLLSFMALTGTLAFFHEPWRDEADTWLMVRDASLLTIAKIVPDMGTPIGWYLILKPFAALGLPFGTQQVLALCLVWGAAAIIIFQGPFSILVSACLCLSWFLSFEYSVIARNYALGVFGLFALLGSWSGRGPARLRSLEWWLAWPLIIFSSVHFLALAPGLILLSVLGKQQPDGDEAPPLVAHLWPLLLLAVAVMSLWPTGHGQLSPEFFSFFKPLNLVQATSLSIFPHSGVAGASAYLGTVVFISFLLVFRLRLIEALAFALMIAGVNSLFVFKYFFPVSRYAGLNWLILVVASWVSLLGAQRNGAATGIRGRIKLFSGLLLLVTLLNLPESVARWRREVALPYTDARNAAQYLINMNLLGQPIACSRPPQCSAILGYLPGRTNFWYPGIDQWGTHMLWDHAYVNSLKLAPEEALLRAKKFLHDSEGHKEFLFISNRTISEPQSLGLTRLWETPRSAWFVKDESFTAYRWQEAAE